MEDTLKDCDNLSERAMREDEAIAAPRKPVFRLENICFSYSRATQNNKKPNKSESTEPRSSTASGQGEGQLFRNLDFALFPGDRIGLCAPNGSGKTTLLRIITGLVRPHTGSIYFQEKSLKTEKDFLQLRRCVGFVLQNADDQLFSPTVLEDVAFGPLNLGFSREEAHAVSLHALDAVGLSGFEHRLTHRLSGGEKKLVCIASVLSMQPEALLLDEPTTGLDREAVDRIVSLLETLGLPRIVVSHDQRFLERVSSSFVTFSDGRLQYA